MRDVIRRDWFGALQYYPSLIVDAFLLGVPKEKVVKASDLMFLELEPGRFKNKTKMSGMCSDKTHMTFMNWMTTAKSNGAKRAYAVEIGNSKPYEFSIAVEFPKKFEVWQMSQNADFLLWQLGRADCESFLKSSRMKSIRGLLAAYRNDVRSEEKDLGTTGEAAFFEALNYRSSLASIIDFVPPIPSPALHWLSQEVEKQNNKIPSDERAAWNRWLIDSALGYTGYSNPYMPVDSSEQRLPEIFWSKISESVQKPRELADSRVAEVTRVFRAAIREDRSFKRAELRFEVPPETDSEISEVMFLLKKTPESIQLFNAALAASKVESTESTNEKIQGLCQKALFAAVNEGERRVREGTES